MIPLLAALAWRLTRRSSAALIAALLATFHPLLLYYSQEARMYSLLTALGVLLVYCGVRSADGRPTGTRRQQFRFILLYVLAGTAAVYTHYFAFFLLFALAVPFLIEQFRLNGSHKLSLIRTFVLANFVILLLYIPWFTFLFNRLAVDASYWQGQLKLWEALRSVAINFTSGQTVQETQATGLLIPYGLVTLLAIGVMWGIERRGASGLRSHAERGNEAGIPRPEGTRTLRIPHSLLRPALADCA